MISFPANCVTGDRYRRGAFALTEPSFRGDGIVMKTSGTHGDILDCGPHVWRVQEDAGYVVFLDEAGYDRPVGVLEFWKGFQGSSNRPAGSAYYALRNPGFTGDWLEYKGDRSAVPEGAYRIQSYKDGDADRVVINP